MRSGSGGQRRLYHARGAMLVSISTYLQYGVGLITIPIIARTLGPVGIGYVAMAAAGYAFGSVIVDLGVSMPLAARVVSGRDDESLLRRRYLAIRLIAVGLAALGYLATLVAQAPYAVALILFGLLAGGLSSIPDYWVLTLRSWFGRIALYRSLGQLIYLVGLVLFLQIDESPYAVPLALGVSNLAVAIAVWFSLRTTVVAPRVGGSSRPAGALTHRQILRLGLPAVTARLMDNAYTQSSAGIFAAFLGPLKVGHFAAGDRLVRAVQSCFSPINLSLFPRFAAIGTRAALWSKVRAFVYRLMLAAGAATVVIWVSSPFAVRLIYGPDFGAVVTLLRVESLLLPAAVAAGAIDALYFNVIGDTKASLVNTTGGLSVLILGLVGAAFTHSVYAALASAIAAEVVVFVVSFVRAQRSAQRGDLVEQEFGVIAPRPGRRRSVSGGPHRGAART